jgi:hypothetical protein
MPVLNEERFLPATLKNLSPHVDEIVIVDGGPEGPSTDRTKEIAKACDKVQYTSGQYATLDGAWDMAGQRNDGIALSTGDFLLFISADMFFMNLEGLRDVVEAEDHKIVFCATVEFWRDTKHVRLYAAQDSLLTLPAAILEAIGTDRSLSPYTEETGHLNLDGATIEDKVTLPGTIKFHMGWLRPFGEQVAKHIRHTKQHRWGPDGERRLQGSPRVMEQWAILHTLSYEKGPAVAYSGSLPPELEPFADMQWDEGKEDVLMEFERRYGISPFKMRKQDAA